MASVYRLIFPRSPCFLITTRPGCSQDSQGTHVAKNRCAACKHRPGFACVYPTTLIGYCRAPPAQDINTDDDGCAALAVMKAEDLLTRGRFCSETRLVQKIGRSRRLFSAAQLHRASEAFLLATKPQADTVAATVAAQHCGSFRSGRTTFSLKRW